MDLAERKPHALLADKGYDSNDIREDLKRRGIKSVIPPRSNRKTPIRYDIDISFKNRTLRADQQLCLGA